MNVCHGDGPFVIFGDSWPTGNDPQSAARKAADPEWLDYCRAREFTERSAAMKAVSNEARRIHQELAQAYARMIQRAER
jgi:hypothetical protein